MPCRLRPGAPDHRAVGDALPPEPIPVGVAGEAVLDERDVVAPQLGLVGVRRCEVEEHVEVLRYAEAAAALLDGKAQCAEARLGELAGLGVGARVGPLVVERVRRDSREHRCEPFAGCLQPSAPDRRRAHRAASPAPTASAATSDAFDGASAATSAAGSAKAPRYFAAG